MIDLKLILRSKSTMPKIPKQPTVPEGNEDEREPGGNGDDEVIHVYPCLLSVVVAVAVHSLYRR